MLDRYKFRAWNKEEKRMYYDAQDTYDYITGQPIIPAERFATLLEDEKEWIVEQCVGIKDRSGRLIYEGDIIRYCVNWRAYCLTYTRVVAWDKNTAGFILVNGKTQVKPLQKWRFPDPETHIIEIVGNIHEVKGGDNE